MIYYYISAFIFYMAFAYVIRRFVLKIESNFKDIIISALLGLLFYVVYIEIFANHG